MDRSAADPSKRLLVVTAGNLHQNHLYIHKHYAFFRPDCIGESKKKANGSVKPIEIVLDGLNEVICTDIGTNAKTGKPRGFFRDRIWVRRFFEHHKVAAGDQLALERVAGRRYRLTVERTNGNGRTLKAAEFFAGIGLVRLALERQGWHVVFANDIDRDTAEMYRHNWPKDENIVVGDIKSLSE